jgi:hypothetical protein
MQAAGGWAEETVVRHISAVIGPLMSIWSVVLSGVVQCSWTTSPTRSALRSFTTSGRSSDGGRGWPGLAQPPAHAIRSPVAAADKPLRTYGWKGIRENFIDL